MTIDNRIKKVQLELMKLADELQIVRELRLRATNTKREKKDKALAETSKKIKEFFDEHKA